jgi:HSP20 family protein
MSLTTRKNGGFPSLLSDFFSQGLLLDRDFFDSSFFQKSRLGINFPTANITETSKEYKLELAAPGLERNDFQIELESNTLTIRAEKEEEKKKDDETYSRKEYSFNAFCRTFTLPENVNESSIDAKYENGILIVTIPKLKETPLRSTRKISVS